MLTAASFLTVSHVWRKSELCVCVSGWKLKSERKGSRDCAPGNESSVVGEGGCLGVFLFVE